MKKLLLTLGSAAAVVAPLATVVACGEADYSASLTKFTKVDLTDETNEDFVEALKEEFRDFEVLEQVHIETVYAIDEEYWDKDEEAYDIEKATEDYWKEVNADTPTISDQNRIDAVNIILGWNIDSINISMEAVDEGYILVEIEDYFEDVMPVFVNEDSAAIIGDFVESATGVPSHWEVTETFVDNVEAEITTLFTLDEIFKDDK